MLELDGKYIFGSAKVGEKGQIVIPKDARDTFGIKPGDSVMVVGDAKSGLALITDKTLAALFSGIFSGAIPTPPPGMQGTAPIPPQGEAAPQNAGFPPTMPQGFPPQGTAPAMSQGFPPQGTVPVMPQGFPPQGTVPVMPQGFPPQGTTPAMPQGFPLQSTASTIPQTAPTQGNAPHKDAGGEEKGAH